jgi:hypothetical protein
MRVSLTVIIPKKKFQKARFSCLQLVSDKVIYIIKLVG